MRTGCALLRLPNSASSWVVFDLYRGDLYDDVGIPRPASLGVEPASRHGADGLVRARSTAHMINGMTPDDVRAVEADLQWEALPKAPPACGRSYCGPADISSLMCDRETKRPSSILPMC